MKWNEDFSIAALWVVILGGLAVLFAFGLQAAIQALGDIIVAFIGAGALLLGAILTHALTELREQRQRRAALMQTHYLDLLSRIDGLVRGSALSDDFSKIHLTTWAVGSPDVIERTQAIADAQSGAPMRKALEELVLAMRGDLGLSEPTGVELKYVFPEEHKRHAS
jgi:hypothetical protein